MPQLAVVKELGDAELVERLRVRDHAAFDVVYDRHAEALLRLAYRLVGSADDAEDVVQDVFVGLPLALRRYDERGAFGAWLRRLTVRTALMHRRSAARREQRAQAAARELPEIASQPSAIDRISLDAAIGTLPEKLRDVFVLHHVEAFSHAEIAELLGIRRGTAEVRLHRAVTRLRSILENDR